MHRSAMLRGGADAWHPPRGGWVRLVNHPALAEPDGAPARTGRPTKTGAFLFPNPYSLVPVPLPPPRNRRRRLAQLLGRALGRDGMHLLAHMRMVDRKRPDQHDDVARAPVKRQA